MNQTKKRLTIINLAISITDMETIQLQVSKLGLLKSDIKIVEIISTLNGQNYAQAQRLISEYIDAPNETVLQRTTQDDIVVPEETETSQEETDAETIEEFDLFTTPAYETSEDVQTDVNYDAFLDTSTQTQSTQTETKEVNYDPLLNVEADDILPNNIDLDLSQKNNESVENTTEEIAQSLAGNVNKETLVHENTASQEILTKDDNDNIYLSNEKDNKNQSNEDYTIPPNNDGTYSIEDDKYLSYEAIPHINTKFNNLYAQYPPIEHTQSRYYSVENWLLQVSTKGYTETEVETRITEAEELKNSNLGESAQLLIAAGATESLYALFQLARALYIGDILQRNIPESVTLIHYLAINEAYPEAICDLGQFYEKGIEVEQNKSKAEELYKEAMHLGIQRAAKHYQRIQKEKKSIFSIFQK
jgi:hypothetical protein